MPRGRPKGSRNRKEFGSRKNDTPPARPPPPQPSVIEEEDNGADTLITVEENDEPNEQQFETPQDEETGPPDDDVDLVFQCASCNIVVGDTRTEYQAFFKSGTLSLKAACNVSIQSEIHASKKGFDAGCTYKKVACTNCKAVLGRVYASTTSSEMDNRRNFYNFINSALNSHQLGSSRTIDGKPAPAEKKKAKPMDTLGSTLPRVHSRATQGVASGELERLNAHVYTLAEALNETRENLSHVQNMLLLWEERFRRLEACEQTLTQVADDLPGYHACQKRLEDLEQFLQEFGAINGIETQEEQRIVTRPQQQTMRVIPGIRKNVTRSPGNRRRK